MRQQKPAPAPTRAARRKAPVSGGQNRPSPRTDVFTSTYNGPSGSVTTAPWQAQYRGVNSVLYRSGDTFRLEPLADDGDLTPDELELYRAQMARERLCVTKADAAKMLSVSVSTISKLIGRGDLPVMKIGTAARIRTADLIAYVDGLAS